MIRSRTLSIMIGTVCLASIGSLADDNPYFENFDFGGNPSGWTFGGPFESIEDTGGNPDGWLHSGNVDTFAPIARHDDTIDTPWGLGDYAAWPVVSIGVDAQTLSADFPVNGFELSILLRDTKQTPDIADDDYAYFVGPEIPLPGQGWQSYLFEIPSQSKEPVPPGWHGGWIGDGENFRPGIDWTDVITSVDRVEFWWINPSFFAILQNWDVGIDNLTLKGVPEPAAGMLLAIGAALVARRRRR